MMYNISIEISTNMEHAKSRSGKTRWRHWHLWTEKLTQKLRVDQKT